MKTLRKGTEGSDVVTLQVMLNRAGANLEDDGVFGSVTEKAVKAFQKKRRIKEDGVVGPVTWGELELANYEAIGRATVKALEGMADLPSVADLLALL